MSKAKIAEAEVSANNVAKSFEGKSNEELEETINILQKQLEEYQTQANRFATMATKAQGALEVLVQMVPAPEKESEKENG
tara:strand:+ start:384 stop:623 length:240 start_codon:yes stop_codon:yes gene_type:complete